MTLARSVLNQYGQVVAVYVIKAGSSLAADLANGATYITPGDLDDFADDGGSLYVQSLDAPDTVSAATAYSGVDRDVGRIMLAAPWAGGAFAEGDGVYCYPAATERRADVALDGEEDQTVVARIPYVLAANLPLGVRPDHAGEWVRVVVTDYGYSVTDAALEAPQIDPEILPPVEVPPAQPSDGIPPASSPTPTVLGAISALVVTWPAITNADPVTYQVWVQPPGGSGEVAGSVGGTGPLWIKHLADGTPLTPGVTYSVWIVATDADGAAPAGAVSTGVPVQATSGDIAANSITADQIVAGSIYGEHLAASVVVGTKIVTPSETGQRVQIDPGGLANYGPSEDLQVLLPTTPGQAALFRGLIEATVINVLQAIHVAGTESTLEPAAVMTLRQGLRATSTPPTVRNVWPSIPLPLAPGIEGATYTGLVYVANGYGSQPTFIVGESRPDGTNQATERRASDGAYLRDVGHRSDYPHRAFAVDPTYIYYLTTNSSNKQVELWRARRSDGLLDTGGVVTGIPTFNNGQPVETTLGYDGAALWIGWLNDGDNLLRIRKGTMDATGVWTWDAAAALVANATLSATKVKLTALTFAEGYVWFQENGSPAAGDCTLAYNPANLAYMGDQYQFHTPTRPAGGTFDGAVFRSLFSDGTLITHTAWNWTSGSARYWTRYTWFEDNAPAGIGAGDYETASGPATRLDLEKRAAMEVTLPTFPPVFVVGAAMAARIYVAGPSSTDPGAPASHLQGGLVTTSTSRVTSYDAAGAAPPAVGSFPTGTPAVLATDEGNPLLRANGFSRFRIRKTGTQSPGNAAEAYVGFDTEDADTDNYWAGGQMVTVPFTGTYLLQASCQWASAGGGYRWAWLQSSPDGTTWTDLPGLKSNSGTLSGGQYTNYVGGMVGLIAGSRLRMAVQQNSGSGLALSPAALQGVFLGPT